MLENYSEIQYEMQSLATKNLNSKLAKDPHVERMINSYAELLFDYKKSLESEISSDIKSLLFNLYSEFNIPQSCIIFCDCINKQIISSENMISSNNNELFKPMINVSLNNIEFHSYIENSDLIFEITRYDMSQMIYVYTNLNNMEAIFGKNIKIEVDLERFGKYREKIIIEANNDFSLFEYCNNPDLGNIFKINLPEIQEKKFKIYIPLLKRIFASDFRINCIPIQNKFNYQVISENSINIDYNILKIESIKSKDRYLNSFKEDKNGYFCTLENNNYLLNNLDNEKKEINLICSSKNLKFNNLYFKDYFPVKIIDFTNLSLNNSENYSLLLQLLNAKTVESLFYCAMNYCNLYFNYVQFIQEIEPKIIGKYLSTVIFTTIKFQIHSPNLILLRKIENYMTQKFDCKLEFYV